MTLGQKVIATETPQAQSIDKKQIQHSRINQLLASSLWLCGSVADLVCTNVISFDLDQGLKAQVGGQWSVVSKENQKAVSSASVLNCRCPLTTDH